MFRATSTISSWLAATLLVASTAAAEEDYQARGTMRAGMSMTTAGTSSLVTSAALLASTDLDAGPIAAMAGVGLSFVAAGVPLWVLSAPGQRREVRNEAMMRAGMVMALFGLAALAPSSGLLATGLHGDNDPVLLWSAAVIGISANVLIGVGSPLWARGAANP